MTEPKRKKPTERKVKDTLTSILHAYEALIEDPQKNADKWLGYGNFDHCKLCQIFRSDYRAGDTEISCTYYTVCGSCPLSGSPDPIVENPQCVETPTYERMWNALQNYRAVKLDSNVDAGWVNGVWQIKWIDRKVTVEQETTLKKAATERYKWILKQIKKHGYEYK